MTIGARSISPCVGICKIDERSGYCLGCARTRDEIASWGGQSTAYRQSVWDVLPSRFAALGIARRRLPWDSFEIRSFVADTIARAAGTWSMGVVGAVGEFLPKEGLETRIHVEGDVLTAETPGAGLRWRLDDAVRALTFDVPPGTDLPNRIALAVKSERGGPPIASALAALGTDDDAISDHDLGTPWFDLGLGRTEVRFALRVSEGTTARLLEAHIGTPLDELLTAIGPALVEASPVRVIETAIGRMEVATPIPPPGGRPPTGPHTHLLPEQLASMRATPTGLDLPPAYLPGAIFYSRRS